MAIIKNNEGAMRLMEAIVGQATHDYLHPRDTRDYLSAKSFLTHIDERYNVNLDGNAIVQGLDKIKEEERRERMGKIEN